MNMIKWLETAAASKKPMPILSFPGVQLTGISVNELVSDGSLQAKCMRAVADRWDTLASVSLMDLSVEAEAFGSPVRFSDVEVPTVSGAIVTDEAELEGLAVPSVGDGRTGIYVETIREAKKLITDRPVFAGILGPYSLAGRLMDLTEIMMLCYDEPELVHGVLEKVTQFQIKYATAMRDAGADGIIMAEPAAGILSPSMIGEFSTPYVRRIIEAVETENCIFIYHNCGNSTLTLTKEILDTGARAFHFGNAIDLSEMLKLIPSDKLVMGNVDPAGQFRTGTPQSVREATLDVLGKCGGAPNFIVSSGCDIPPASPIENIDAFFAAVREYYS
ncbi:MAG: uroporphyrinogen decarboxylase family protein [Oscillospiraceae bacterium]|nr:uroporphyrinogen decarboxylase family protein [Oscillospiraceae bacterium]